MDKKILGIILFLSLTAVLTGCARVSTYVIERTDQDLAEGNRGYLQGELPPLPPRGKLTRTVINIEFELPPFPEWRRHYWTDKELWGNRGYIAGGPPRETVMVPKRSIPSVREVEKKKEVPEVVIIEEPLEEPVKKKLPFWKKKLPATHTVKKGECLWYIAGYPEIYGNPLEWPKIYKANRDIIRDPDVIYPGQVLRIPREGESLAAPKPAKKKWIK